MEVVNAILLLYMVLFGILNGLGIVLFKVGFETGKFEETNIAKRGVKGSILLIASQLKYLLRNWRWMTGAALYILAFVFYQLALRDFSIIDVKVLQNLNLVISIIFSVIICKERLNKFELVGIITSFSGFIITGLAAKQIALDVDYFGLFLFIFLDLGLTLGGIFLFYKCHWSYEYTFPIFSGNFFCLGIVVNKFLLQDPLSLGVEVIVNLLQNPYLYLFVASYILGAVTLQVVASTEVRISISYFIGNLQTTILSILAGLWIFREPLFEEIAGTLLFPWSFGKLFGILLVLAGIAILFWEGQRKNAKETLVPLPHADGTHEIQDFPPI